MNLKYITATFGGGRKFWENVKTPYIQVRMQAE